VCDLETSRMGAPYIYDLSHLRVNFSLVCMTSYHSSLPLGHLLVFSYVKHFTESYFFLWT